MVVNMGGDQRGAGPPQWFIRAGWHQGPGGHVHVVTPPADLPAVPAPAQPAAGNQPTDSGDQPGQDIARALQALARQVSQLQAANDRLRQDNDRLSSEIGRIRALTQQASREIARRVTELLAGTED
jgi:hypothetical protein